MSDLAVGRRHAAAASPRNRALVSAWLFAVCVMIWVMVGIGGFTRESGSGLSIMNWDPIVGAVPPLTHAAWEKLFALYQTIPQARILHPNIDLAGFKTLFWPEYLHRLWGRLIGLVFFLPLVWFIATRRIEGRLIPWLVLLFLLGGLQGAIGWFMVSSGFFPDSTAVEPWRLTLHFSAAMLLFVAVQWTGLTVRHPVPTPWPGSARLRGVALLALLLLACTLLAGTAVSGTHAIKVFDPVKNIGTGAPPPGWSFSAAFADKANILFNHQALAALTTLAVLAAAVMALRGRTPRPVRDAGLMVAGLVLLQFTLGVTTLVSGIKDIAVAHQMNAVLLLAALVLLLHRLRGARG